MVWFAKQSKVLDFLHDVSKDETLQQKLKKEDSRKVMAEHGLSEAEIEMLHADDHRGVLRGLLHRVEDD